MHVRACTYLPLAVPRAAVNSDTIRHRVALDTGDLHISKQGHRLVELPALSAGVDQAGVGDGGAFDALRLHLAE